MSRNTQNTLFSSSTGGGTRKTENTMFRTYDETSSSVAQKDMQKLAMMSPATYKQKGNETNIYVSP